MKAISLWQPWASLIAVGAKQYETRSWDTKYRGPLVICASKWGQRPGFDRLTLLGLLKNPEFAEALNPEYGKGNSALLLDRTIYDNLPFGKAVAIANLTDCIPTSQIMALWLEGRGPAQISREINFGDFSPGRFAWKLEGIKGIDPFPVRGRQGLFEVELNLEEA